MERTPPGSLAGSRAAARQQVLAQYAPARKVFLQPPPRPGLPAVIPPFSAQAQRLGQLRPGDAALGLASTSPRPGLVLTSPHAPKAAATRWLRIRSSARSCPPSARRASSARGQQHADYNKQACQRAALSKWPRRSNATCEVHGERRGGLRAGLGRPQLLLQHGHLLRKIRRFPSCCCGILLLIQVIQT